MNKKYKITYLLILLSIMSISLLSYNLYTAYSRYNKIYENNINKLNKINNQIKKSKNNITKLNKGIEDDKKSISDLKEEKSNLEDAYRKVLKNNNKESNGVGKVVYLTFDDGPSPYTEDILNILDKYGVKATFFMTCKDNTKEFAKKIKEKGHTVALHTCTHDYGIVYESEENYFNDLNDINNLVKDEIHEDTYFIRFPGGSSNTVSRFTKGIMTTLTNKVKERGYKYFDWNIDSMDASGYNSEKEYEPVVSELRYSDRNINMILMHDTKLSTRDSLERIIEDAKNMGYEFSKITEFTPEVHHMVNN